MIVNENRLQELLDNVFNTTCPCEVCPLEKCLFEKCHIDDCEEAIMQYLQGFDVAEALEAGAHIVNDQVIFPPKELHFCPFGDDTCFNYADIEPCLNCPYAE